jgi:hypothetical protein
LRIQAISSVLTLDFLQKSGKRLKEKGEREERFLSPLTFYLSPLAKVPFARGLLDEIRNLLPLPI